MGMDPRRLFPRMNPVAVMDPDQGPHRTASPIKVPHARPTPHLVTLRTFAQTDVRCARRKSLEIRLSRAQRRSALKL